MREKNIFCSYRLQAFSAEQILKRHNKDCFKIDRKQRIIMHKNSEYVKFRNYERKIKSLFIIYVDFASILEPENNEKQNPEESFKYQISNKYCLQLWL